ncbi:hypothetical protein Acor_37060 [Acrocarpospora corrugata]|uniref:Uncharacterized protein n=1 Tax=Acrocarpospora corrugata TaxID=35763 RepID=A0A5M3W0T8_9ACTN|nr:hypothetical protein [Acrocarpospora corrugata]GES01642.1 hypothetical protein Acor_37060 [Acrocarpospora corrugata]
MDSAKDTDDASPEDIITLFTSGATVTAAGIVTHRAPLRVTAKAVTAETVTGKHGAGKRIAARPGTGKPELIAVGS